MSFGKKFLAKFGNYPKEYNPAVHGPYYPWVNYASTKDTPFWELKLGEVKPWLQRRNKAPHAAISTVARYTWIYRNKWLETKHGSPAKAIFQCMIVGSFLSMIGFYGHLRNERLHKYHW